jgi:nucleotide-binding universal stress UspA family protein
MALHKIVVGVDLSPGSEIAARRATELAAHHGAELVLVHAVTLPEHPAVPSSMQPLAENWFQVLHARLAENRAALAELRTRLSASGVTVSQALIDRYPDEALVQAATELHADLIVVGSRHRGGLRHWLLGSVAEHLVRTAPVSVLVARAGDPDQGFERIVVGTDFSEHAEVALERALELARPGATVDVVHCFHVGLLEPDVNPSFGNLYDDVLEIVSRDAHERGAALLARHAAAPVTLRFEFLEASPREGLCDLAEQRRADLVAVGSHGRRGLRRLILGSVAEATVRHAPCSVFVVH